MNSAAASTGSLPSPAVSSPGDFRTPAPECVAPFLMGRHPKIFAEAEVAAWREQLGKCAEKRSGFRDLGEFRRRQKAFNHAGEQVLGFERAAGRMIELRQR